MVELWRDFIDNDDTDEDLEEVELNEYHFVLEQMCDAAGPDKRVRGRSPRGRVAPLVPAFAFGNGF